VLKPVGPLLLEVWPSVSCRRPSFALCTSRTNRSSGTWTLVATVGYTPTGYDSIDRYHRPQIFKTWIDIAVTGFPEPVAQTRECFALSHDIALVAGSGHRVTLWETTLDTNGAGDLNERVYVAVQRTGVLS
jgi:hypothetical protein